MTDELTLVKLPVLEEPTEEYLVLWEDAVPLEPLEVDGRTVAFTWFHDSGIDRLSATIDEFPLGTIENLDTPMPRMLSGSDWGRWLADDARLQRVLDAAKHRWIQRHALFDGYRSRKCR